MISRCHCHCNSASYPSLLGLSLLCTTATALALGNCIILNPPSHCAASAARIVDLSVEAGMPSGVVQVVHGDASIFSGLSEHPDIAAVIFAGASVPAEAVYKRCTAANKRVVAFGGAKNHVFALPECHVTATARDVTTAFTAHAGQRRLAASVLVLVGDGSEQVKRAFLDTLVPEIVSLAGKLEAGQKPGQMGPLADAAARDRLVLPYRVRHSLLLTILRVLLTYCRVLAYITEAEANGAKILLDGRRWAAERPTSNYVGPTVILHASASDRALKEEIFGPVLSIYCANSWEEAVAIEHSCAYGVASSVYTEKGSHAEWFVQRFRAALVGVNDCFVPSRGSLFLLALLFCSSFYRLGYL
jgi:malonate-semialdehyde dehydrogenase (acetylating)/methylmalonate-semialdehyde dehydrogenase